MTGSFTVTQWEVEFGLELWEIDRQWRTIRTNDKQFYQLSFQHLRNSNKMHQRKLENLRKRTKKISENCSRTRWTDKKFRKKISLRKRFEKSIWKSLKIFFWVSRLLIIFRSIHERRSSHIHLRVREKKTSKRNFSVSTFLLCKHCPLKLNLCRTS